jgi:predicted hydrocarbon binding protein
MVNTGRPNCAIAKGSFESIFSKHFQSEVLVDEIKCIATGDKYCSFVIKKLDKKIKSPVKGSIEFI